MKSHMVEILFKMKEAETGFNLKLRNLAMLSFNSTKTDTSIVKIFFPWFTEAKTLIH